jgi:ribosomal protein S18 acetylase RimI-like enzyme
METTAPQSRTIKITELTAGSPSEIEEARELLLEYGRFVVAQQGVVRFCFGSLEKEAQALPAGYQEQGGGCLLAHADGKPVGFVAWRALPSARRADAWELKRLWVRPSARGLGLGRTLTVEVLNRATQAGRKAVYLDTVPESMAAAHRLYLELGFTPCERYNDNPVEGLAYLVKLL